MFLIKVSKNKIPNLLGADFKLTSVPWGRVYINILHNEESFDLLNIGKISNPLVIESDTVSGRAIFYAHDANGDLIISSHVKLLEMTGIELIENEAVIPEYLVNGIIAPPNTLFKDIFLLGFGEKLEIKLAAQYFELKRRQTLKVERCDKGKDPVNIQAMFEGLSRTVSTFAGRSNQLAILFSGGTDSSLVAKLAKDNKSPYETYTADYPIGFGPETGESYYAQTAAAALGLRHNVSRMSKEDYFSDLVDAIHGAEMPIAHSQSVLLFDLFKRRIPRTCQFILSGQGADSIVDSVETTISYAVSKSMPLMKFVPMNSTLRNVLLDAYYTFNKGYNPAQYLLHCTYSLKKTDSPFWFHAMHGHLEWVKAKFGLTNEQILASKMAEMTAYDGLPMIQFATVYNLIGDTYMTQVIWRKLAESQGMRLILPFADKEIIRLGSKISYETIYKSRKNLLRELGQLAQMPDFIFERPKKAFGFDVRSWGGPRGLLKKLLEQTANGPYGDLYQNELEGETKKEAMTLWYLLNYYIWRSLFIEKRPEDEIFKERLAVIP